jgi:hypothetical protein
MRRCPVGLNAPTNAEKHERKAPPPQRSDDRGCGVRLTLGVCPIDRIEAHQVAFARVPSIVPPNQTGQAIDQPHDRAPDDSRRLFKLLRGRVRV